MRAAQQRHDAAAIADLRVPVWRLIFQGVSLSDADIEAVRSLTPRQLEMLRRWVIQRTPRDAIGERHGSEEKEGAWVEVGSLRSQPESQQLRDVRVAPLFAQHHGDTRYRYNYRMRFHDSSGGEAWVHLGDEDALRDGLRWIRHGSTVTALDTNWTAFLQPQLRTRMA